MRLIALLFALISFLTTGCDKADEEPEFAATYKGTYTRMKDSPAYSPMVANVTLNFTENTYTGKSNSINYPAICTGTFRISQSKIQVENGCAFTADFDGTLIFHGDYHYELVGNQLRIWRDYPGGSKDIYILTKAL